MDILNRLAIDELPSVLDIELSANRLHHLTAHQVVDYTVCLERLGIDGADAGGTLDSKSKLNSCLLCRNREFE